MLRAERYSKAEATVLLHSLNLGGFAIPVLVSADERDGQLFGSVEVY